MLSNNQYLYNLSNNVQATIMCLHELFLATFLSYPQINPASHHNITSFAKSVGASFMDFAKPFNSTQSASVLTPAARAAGIK